MSRYHSVQLLHTNQVPWAISTSLGLYFRQSVTNVPRLKLSVEIAVRSPLRNASRMISFEEYSVRSSLIRSIGLHLPATVLIMVVILPKGSMRNKWNYGITHFLRIPIATPESTPQLLQSLGHVAQDPIAAALPRAAWRTPDELHYHVAPLSLLEPGRLDRAIRLLRGLNMNRISKAIAAASGTNVVNEPAGRSTEMVHSVQAPITSLQGLGLPPNGKNCLRKTKEMVCNIRERRPFLKQFKSIVFKIFQDADLIQISGSTSTTTTSVMATKYLRTDVPNDKSTLRWKEAVLEPYFDASDLISKYNDFRWTTDFSLEQLCISELELKDFVRNGEVVRMGYHDVASVPLPGSVSCGALDQDINSTYRKAAKTIKETHPVCPLVIPSSPP